ncbi:MAG TPA: winged helix-turn-helix domain-containing protein [Ktedonobacterales bacterium]|nr:winged helix-turn-helix domain-containing protein [Ktedonobacterales bacterium]
MPAQSAATTLPLVLVAHHARDTVELLRSLLEHEGYTALCAYNGRIAEQLARHHHPALLLLDQDLPLLDGLELCRTLRRASEDAPAIFILSSRPDELSKLLAFGAGADDYLALPMHPRELLARMTAALRRTGAGPAQLAEMHRCGPIELDPEQREARAAGQPLALTSLEYELLAVFVAHPGRVYSREDLLRRLAGFLRGEPFDRAVDIHVSNLRRKLRAALGEDAPIETVRGVGYRLRGEIAATVEASPPPPGSHDLGRLALVALGRAPTPLLVLSPDRTVLLYNEAAEHLCGWKAEEVAGQVKCYSLLGCHDEAGALLCHGRCVLRQGMPRGVSDQQAQYVITLKDGRELPVTAHYSRLDGAGVEGDCTLLVLQPRG